MSPDLSLQKALLARLRGDAGVLALVALDAMRDGQALPQIFPSILLGEGQWLREGLTVSSRHRRIYSTLHVWTKSMPDARAIADAVVSAIDAVPLEIEGGHEAVSIVIRDCRFLRDPDGATSHGVITVDSLIEVAS